MARTPSSAPKTRRAATKPAAPEKPQLVTSYDSIGSLFDGKVDGEYQLKLDPQFLEMLGMEIDPEANYTMVIKHRQGKSGYEYRSCFLATEAPAAEGESEEQAD